ncbi:ras-related protein rab7-like [Salvelinus alpinus]|uniref:ras-related protein rab7-like n=1 Tax=Salvelinus alpinus TaxID=8036 RepID=UPI0039FBC15C
MLANIQYVNYCFTDMYLATIGLDFLTKEVSLEGSAVILQIWDTAVAESFQSLGMPLYRGFHCCLTLFNITSETSFSALEVWRKSDLTDFPFIVIHNKTELSNKRDVSVCKLPTSTVGAQYCEGRAKGDIDVAKPFSNAARTAFTTEKIHYSLQYKKHTSKNTGQFQITCKQPEEIHKCQC